MLNAFDSLEELLGCEVCQGTGYDGRHRCRHCQGAGLASLRNGKLYFWRDNLSLGLVHVARLKRMFEWTVDTALFVVGGVGLFALAQFILLSEDVLRFDITSIFYTRHFYLLIFWCTVLADLYLFYRISENRTLKQRIGDWHGGTLRSDMPEVRHLDLSRIKSRDKVDILGGFNVRALRRIEDAVILAAKLQHGQVQPVHLLEAVLKDAELIELFFRLNIDEHVILDKLNRQLSKMPPVKSVPRLSSELRAVFINAFAAAAMLDEERVRPIHFLMPILAADKTLHEIFYGLAVDENDVVNAVTWFAVNAKMTSHYRQFREMARFKPSSNMDRAYTAQATPLLNAFGRDLTLSAKYLRLAFCVARDKEIGNIFAQFSAGHPGVLLVGEVGVGKHTLVGGIAQLMVEENVPGMFKDKRLVELDISRLLAGASASAAQERLQSILDEVEKSGNIIVVINNVETIAGISAGGEESLDLADVLISHLEQRGLLCIATVTRENYIKFIEHRPLGQKLAKIDVPEPDQNRAIIMLESKVGYLENNYHVYFSYHALEEVVLLSSKYIHDKFLPAKGIEIMEMLAVSHARGKQGRSVITRDDVAEVVSQVTGVPVTKVGQQESAELLNLEERIHEHMIDQVEAVDAVSAALRRARAQLSEGKRPIASFLFLGPTGVGKTELAKAIAKVYFGNEKYMTRLDMSEYQTQSMITKMIGDADGGKGYLTEAVRQHPFSLVLLDEFEKAHPDILNLFLQVMDDGRLTDGEGRTIDFTNCIIIATSNAGANFIQESIRAGRQIDEIKPLLINDHLTKIMRPELINRFDGLIVFKPLGELEVVEIARLLMSKISATLEEKGIHLRLHDAGLKILAHAGFDPQFGARPLRRLLQDRVENQIANQILAGQLSRRDTVIINDDGEVTIEKASEL